MFELTTLSASRMVNICISSQADPITIPMFSDFAGPRYSRRTLPISLKGFPESYRLVFEVNSSALVCTISLDCVLVRLGTKTPYRSKIIPLKDEWIKTGVFLQICEACYTASQPQPHAHSVHSGVRSGVLQVVPATEWPSSQATPFSSTHGYNPVAGLHRGFGCPYQG